MCGRTLFNKTATLAIQASTSVQWWLCVHIRDTVNSDQPLFPHTFPLSASQFRSFHSLGPSCWLFKSTQHTPLFTYTHTPQSFLLAFPFIISTDPDTNTDTHKCSQQDIHSLQKTLTDKHALIKKRPVIKLQMQTH